MTCSIQTRKERIEVHLICLELISKSVTGVLRYFFFVLLQNEDLGTYLFVLFFTLCIVRYYVCFLFQRDVINSILLTALALMCVGLSYALFQNTRLYVSKNLINLFAVCLNGIPCMVLFSRVDDWRMILRSLRPYLRTIMPLLCLTHILGGVSFWGYMSWGIRIIPITLLYYIYVKLENGKAIDHVFATMGILFSLLGGRQALVLLIIGVVGAEICDVFSSKKKKPLDLMKIVFTTICFAVSALFYNELLSVVDNLLQRTGINSRALSMLLKNQLFEDKARNGIYSICRRIIRENGVKVSGIFADRYYLAESGLDGYYAHNVVLEILIDFGSLFGGLILIAFFYRLIVSFLRGNWDNRKILVIMVTIGLGRFFVSSSIFVDAIFWAFLGFIRNNTFKRTNGGGTA